MSVPVLTFFNNKGGVGKTSLVYHLSWMFAKLGKRVVAVDLDPQANLTAAFLSEDELEKLWNEDSKKINTVFRAVKPLTGVGDLVEPELMPVASTILEQLYLLPGDVALSDYEETLSDVWPKSLDDNIPFRPFRVLTSFWHVMQMAAEKAQADVLLVDIGPNLGAINRSVLIATDFVLIPLGADLFSIQGLKNLGPTLIRWRSSWKKRLDHWITPEFKLPLGKMQPAGYICQQHSVRLNRPVKAYDRWVNRIPGVYRESVLEQTPEDMKPQDDPLCLANLKHYRSLVPLAQEARKPIFDLTPADGAIGAHGNAVREAYQDFQQLARKIMQAVNL